MRHKSNIEKNLVWPDSISNEAEQATANILFPIHAGSFIPNLLSTYIVIY